jgi:hypothetical protein
MNNIETMKMALEALEEAKLHIWLGDEKGVAANVRCHQTITALRQAIEQAQQAEPWEKFCDSNCVWTDHHPNCKLAQQAEPVAWMHTMDNTEGHKANKPYVLFTKSKRNPFGVAGRDYSKSYPVTKQPLYTSPPVATNDTSQERVDETAKQRHWVGLTEAQCGVLWKTNMTPFEYYKAIEAKLKEKNT